MEFLHRGECRYQRDPPERLTAARDDLAWIAELTDATSSIQSALARSFLRLPANGAS
jgi:hypothetical protein